MEESWISTFLRESGGAFFTSLSVHSLAMALVVGINLAVSLRLLTGLAKDSLNPLAKLYPLHWIGVWFIFLSGLALLIAYPAKALTNPVFYLKFAALTAGLVIARHMQRKLIDFSIENPSLIDLKKLATANISLWVVTIAAGRFLAYTNTVLLASRFY